MIAKDFKIDFEKKIISHNPKGSQAKHTVNELYSYLQNIFDEPKYMKYEIPIEAKPGSDRHPAKSKTKYFLINGWSIDDEAMGYLTEGTLTLPKTPS